MNLHSFLKLELVRSEEGSALASVLIIIVIITIFIGIVLSGISAQNHFIQQDVNEVKARYAAEAGIASFLSANHYSSITRDTSLRVMVKDSMQVSIHAKPFGGFLDIESTATIKGKEKKVRVLYGVSTTDSFEQAVILGDTSSVLMLTGSTQLKGDILTGQSGTRTTDFKGISFSGSMEGEQEYRSGKLLPDFDVSFIQNQEEVINRSLQDGIFSSFASNYKGIGNINSMEGDTLYFEENTSWSSKDSIKFPKDLTIVVDGSLSLNGNYHFGSYSKLLVRDTLRVGGSVRGEHQLLYAGKSLQIGGGATLSAQVLSGNEIIIRDDAYLTYPSLLFTSEEFSAERKEVIIDVRDRSRVDGTIIYPVPANNFTSGLFKIRVTEDAFVRGAIYSKGQTELHGTVQGSVLTQQFYFYESPSSYINWLKGAVIDISQRPENYVVPLGFSQDPEYQLLDWTEIQ